MWLVWFAALKLESRTCLFKIFSYAGHIYCEYDEWVSIPCNCLGIWTSIIFLNIFAELWSKEEWEISARRLHISLYIRSISWVCSFGINFMHLRKENDSFVFWRNLSLSVSLFFFISLSFWLIAWKGLPFFQFIYS